MNNGEKEKTSPNNNCKSKLDLITRRFEEIFFATILLAIVGLGLTPIILRIFFNTGITWTEPVARQLVLWIALFGASAATFDRKHISIDIIGHFLPKHLKIIQSVVTSIIAAVVCAIMAWLSVKFVKEEANYSAASSIFASIPEWIFELVLPMGFVVLTLRFTTVTVKDIRIAIHGIHNSQ